MIKYLYANYYKAFVNLKIEFGQSNLLIGSNGVGKSNIFTLIASIRDVIRGCPNSVELNFPQSTHTRWIKSDIQTFELGITTDNNEFVYNIEILHDSNKAKSKISSEKLTCNGNTLYQMVGGTAEVYDDRLNKNRVLVDEGTSGIAFVPQDDIYSRLNEFRTQINCIILCIPNPKNMSGNVQNDVYIPEISFSNVASIYASVVLLEPDIFNELMGAYKEASKDFVKARLFIDTAMNRKRLLLDYKYNDVVTSYSFEELSDGEKMLFALYILLYGYIKRGMTVLLDEPDNFLSLREIQPWCVNIERELGDDGQCLMISHHPEIIDYMAETNGIWMKRLASGETTITDKPNIGENEELYTYSEMISRGLLDEA